jgi:hypothetical protein
MHMAPGAISDGFGALLVLRGRFVPRAWVADYGRWGRYECGVDSGGLVTCGMGFDRDAKKGKCGGAGYAVFL